MNSQPTSQRPVVLVCCCEQAKAVPSETVNEIIEKLAQTDAFELVVVPDLCELAARRDPRLAQWAARPVRIAACSSRAVRWLFAAGNAPLAPDVSLVNLRSTSAEESVEILLKPSMDSNAATGSTVTPYSNTDSLPADWPAWFPVIDYDHCTQCMQCLGFCLFGVYGLSASNRIEVTHPSQCKNNCPACARVCPQQAIIFPKHSDASINGASAVVQSNTNRMKLDLSTLLGGDAHALLRARNERARERFSKDRSDQQALSERRKFLEMQGLIAKDIPPEVLANLPSPELIAKKASEAAARAHAALEARKESNS